MIRIWGRPNSICTQRVLWACVEAGVGFELTLASATMGPDGHVSTGAEPYGGVGASWYRTMNPNGTVPTIDDGGFVLWESNAIVAYLGLEVRYGNPRRRESRDRWHAPSSGWRGPTSTSSRTCIPW